MGRWPSPNVFGHGLTIHISRLSLSARVAARLADRFDGFLPNLTQNPHCVTGADSFGNVGTVSVHEPGFDFGERLRPLKTRQRRLDETIQIRAEANVVVRVGNGMDVFNVLEQDIHGVVECLGIGQALGHVVLAQD